MGYDNLNGSVAMEDLTNVESRLGIVFPADFKAFYLSGGRNRDCANLFNKDGEIHVLNHVFPVIPSASSRSMDVEQVYRDIIMDGRIIPAEFIPFADDPGGDFFCFHAEDGSIWIHRMDYYDEPARAMTRLARSLNEFLAGMTQEETGP